MTRDEFEDLSPSKQGYFSYMLGARDDSEVPNVGPGDLYDEGTDDFQKFERGQRTAVQEVRDGVA